MNLIQPPILKKGDKIAIIASARKISMSEVQSAIAILKSWGLEVVLGKNLFNTDNQFSGTDEERAADLQMALDDASVKAVISARGGYGTVRIIDKIDFSKFKKQPKWVIGYSDITVLHSHIHTFGIETLHATMPINFSKNEEALETLRKNLFGEKLRYELESHPLNRNGFAEAEIVGGNLSLLYALTGSCSDIDTKGKILFIEDLDEYLYHIDRMMMNLKRSGKLNHLGGLVVGGMMDMKDNPIPFGKTAEEIIKDAVKEYDYPVCFNFPAGHIDRNLALVFGRKMKLDVGENGSFLAAQS
ncbi:MAG: LD-carboxypeptidase [Bacteroidetes bacterium]|nr:LD-carboxypeptidase [Bacteroidota bacterium]